jgi:cytoskeleton protein RodZ
MKEEKRKIGSQLKSKRIEKGLSLEKVSRETRIAQKYIKAIEEEQFQKIPSEVVLKGFSRIYSEYLGLDPKNLVSEITKKIKSEIVKEAPEVKPAPKKPVKDIDWTKLVKAAAVCIVLLMAMILVIMALRSLPGYVEKISVESSRSSDGGVQGKMNIDIKIVEKTWMLVIADGKTSFSGILFPGTEKQVTAEDSIIVKMGNAAGVKVTSGKKVLLEPGMPGQVVTKEFRR